MRSISANNLDALSQRRLVARDFLWLKVRTIETGSPFEYGFWSDLRNASALVLDPNTGIAVMRNFEGAGSLIEISDIPLVSNLTVQTVTVTLSQLQEGVASVIRGYDLKQAGVEVYRGLFDPTTRQMVDAALNRFVGFVDTVVITTPKEGEEGSILLTCMSHTQEMTRKNPDTRSQDSQRLRSPTDDFFRDVTSVQDWEFFWGRKAGKIASSSPQRIAISVRAVTR
jgi:hypothetical protein